MAFAAARIERQAGGTFAASAGPGALDGRILGTAAQDRLFECAEPRSDGEPFRFHLVAPNIDVGAFLKRKRKSRDAMVDHRRANLEPRLL